jgi:LPXTG-site transpeptidase (sortase) family protein
MKKNIILLMLGLVAAFGLWASSSVNNAESNVLFAVTSTPSDSMPTPLPTEFLTATPTQQPTATHLPTLTPVPTGTAAPEEHNELPTALPALGKGDEGQSGVGQANSLITRIVIPDLALDLPVLLIPLDEGSWDITGLGAQVGWLGSPLQSEIARNIILAGHLDFILGSGAFASLASIRPDAEIMIYANNDVYQYQVNRIKIVPAEDISVITQDHLPILTLLTCDKESWDKKTRSYSRRLVVIANPIPLNPR